MDLKRKNIEQDGQPKRPKREECPHKKGCYRRNPHHFKQFDHPFLVDLIEMGDTPEIPENLPQPKHVYLEQLDILRPLLAVQKASELQKNSLETDLKKDVKVKTEQKGDKSSDKSNKGMKAQKNSSELKVRKDIKGTANSEISAGPSSSKSPNKVSRKGHTTIFSTKAEENGDNLKIVREPGIMLDKLLKNAPYNLFFTTIPKSSQTYKEPNSITFTDLLCPSLGHLKCSLQINFMIDIQWLLKQYEKRCLDQKPLTILYGDDWPDMVEYMEKFCPNVKHHLVKMRDPFGCHHSKVGIYAYEDNSVRVVVSTANLYFEDWNCYNQGLWMSPKLPKLPEGRTAKDGESPTGFKSDLLNYLATYNLGILKEWIEFVKNADFSEVKVALVYSAPGKHYPKTNGNHLHRVGDLLSKHCNLPGKTSPQSEGPLSWGIMAQASSIGSMGKSAAEWLRGALLRSLASHKQSPLPNNSQATISLVYPSVDNVAHGYFGLESGGCLPYSKATNEKQRWLQSYLHQWKADEKHRTRAMPHIKTYCRVSPGLNKLAYFLLTSANLSKAAWGNNIQKDGGSYVRSYEVGVMFLPKFFDEDYFEVKNTTERKNETLFPFIYDLPLTPYKKDDYPWCN